MKKKLLILSLAAALLFMLTLCGCQQTDGTQSATEFSPTVSQGEESSASGEAQTAEGSDTAPESGSSSENQNPSVSSSPAVSTPASSTGTGSQNTGSSQNANSSQSSEPFWNTSSENETTIDYFN